VRQRLNLGGFARFTCRPIVARMAHPVCSLCSHPRRVEIDADLLGGLSTAAVAKKYSGQQTTFARHLRLHLKPHVHAIARAAGPMMLPPPTPEAQVAQLIPTIGAVLADLGHTVERLKTLADDAERDGGLGMRAVSLRELRAGLTDTAKLLAVLQPAAPLRAEVVDHKAMASALAAAGIGEREKLLQQLLPGDDR
jgi:hypothetical protein